MSRKRLLNLHFRPISGTHHHRSVDGSVSNLSLVPAYACLKLLNAALGSERRSLLDEPELTNRIERVGESVQRVDLWVAVPGANRRRHVVGGGGARSPIVVIPASSI